MDTEIVINKISIKKYKNITCSQTENILDVLNKINNNRKRIIFVIDKNKNLIGSISDGDIRRSLLNKNDKKITIKSIINKKPKVSNLSSTFDYLFNIYLNNKFELIPITKKNKLLGFYEILQKFNKSTSNKVLIMAGGFGKRLMPFTKKTPKPLLLINSRPLIEHLILNFKEQGYNEIIISIHYKSQLIKKYIGNGQKYGVKIDYIEENEPLGTAGSLYFIKKQLKDDENIILINSDILTNINFSKLIKFHNKNKSDITICTKNYEIKNPYGVIHSKNTKFLSIEEKPNHYTNINAGIYVISKEALKILKRKVKIDMTNFILKNKKINANIRCYNFNENWKEFGTLDKFESLINYNDQ